MPEKDPANDAAPGVKRNDRLSRERIERASHDGSLRGIDVWQVCARNQMGMELEPADEGIAFGVFDVVRFREAAEPGAEPITIALPDLGKNSDASDAGGIGHTFHHVAEQRFDVVESAEDARKTQQRHRGVATFQG